jgi:sugar-specific transcriptional regulator TrmB
LGVGELCESLGLEEKQVRAALDQLAGLDLVRASRDRPGKLHALDPQAALEAALRQEAADFVRRQEELEAAKAAAARAVAHFARLRPNASRDGTTRLSGLDAVQARIEQLCREVRGELYSVTPGTSIPVESLQLGRPIDAAMLARAITVRVLYQAAARNNPAVSAYTEWMTAQGAQVRTAPLLPPRLLVFDRECALVPISPADPAAGALCTREPGLLASLIALFEQAFRTGLGHGDPARDGPGHR